MKRRKARPKPPRQPLPSTIGPRTRHTTVAAVSPPARPRKSSSSRLAGRIIDPEDSTLLDVIDNLLGKGVVLNAEVILALAGVDLVYLRLSALLSAADRVLPPQPR